MAPAGSVCAGGAVAVADPNKTRSRVTAVLLSGVVLAGTIMTGGCRGSPTGSSSFIALHRPACRHFLAAANKKGVDLLADGGVGKHARRGRRSDQEKPMSIDAMVASAAGGQERSQAAQAYYERRKEALIAWSEERQGRDLCERCRRARKVHQNRLVFETAVDVNQQPVLHTYCTHAYDAVFRIYCCSLYC